MTDLRTIPDLDLDIVTLATTSLTDLMEQATDIRRSVFGDLVTYSPKVFIPLTMLCNDRCGYCTFAKPPARLTEVYLDPSQVLDIARSGAERGCFEALFTLGERPEERYPVARSWLNERGYGSTIDYVADMAKLVTRETGLLVHGNCGALYRQELEMLRSVCVSQGMMLESVNDSLTCHRGSPDKTPARRIATLQDAGELSIPFTTGLLVGIGDSRLDRLAGLVEIANLHRQYGHIQEVIIQNFVPKPGTQMQSKPACPLDELLWTIAVARIVLPASVHLQAPPNLSEDFTVLLDAGIDDFGGISPVTIDHVNPQNAWPQLDQLAMKCAQRGYTLLPRLTLYPQYVRQGNKWLDDALKFPVLDASDALGYARDSTWYSGGNEPPPQLVNYKVKHSSGPFQVQSGQLLEIFSGVENGQSIDEQQIEMLFGSRGTQVMMICEFADHLRKITVGDSITFVNNRNINYTNVCTFKCKFCAFSKGPLSLNLRGSPYLLSLDDITERVAEAVELGATEVCLQGGIHPSFDGEYYLDVIGAVRKASESIHIHGFTALEVYEGARRLGVSLEDYLKSLRDAGLKTLPGTAAEILDDEIRQIICPDKISTSQWLEVHSTAHKVGLRSNITIMFGSVESPRSWAKHIAVTRSLQEQTGGFTEFVPLPFVHMASPIYLQRLSRRGPTFREALLMHAVGRIAYHGYLDNIQVSWVKMGMEGTRQALVAGANDIGGTLINENISRAAGASHGQAMNRVKFEELVKPLKRRLVQRNTLYGRIA